MYTFGSVTLLAALCLASAPAGAQTSAQTDAQKAQPTAADYLADAQALPGLIAANYAYLDHLPGGVVPDSPVLDAERDAVHDHDSLLRYAEDMITALADYHGLTQDSFKDDWAIVPSYSDLWIVLTGDDFVVDAVKPGSPAERAGVKRGDRLTAVDGMNMDTLIRVFWARLGLEITDERAAYAARVLAAGRRDGDRHLTIGGRDLTLPSLYADHSQLPPVTVIPGPKGATTIRLNNDLGDDATITAFDAAMARIPPHARVVIDLTDTPSGGNTSVARAIMGWFVTKPMPYQVHNLPSEMRETGIARQWIEEVLPRAGKYHPDR